jgi:hypothetical protein
MGKGGPKVLTPDWNVIPTINPESEGENSDYLTSLQGQSSISDSTKNGAEIGFTIGIQNSYQSVVFPLIIPIQSREPMVDAGSKADFNGLNGNMERLPDSGVPDIQI